MSSRKLNNIFGQVKSEKNNTMFHLIAEAGLDDILDRIWNATGKDELEKILKMKNNDGETCLHSALKNLRGSGAEKMMAQLFDMGADLNAQNAKGDTVLHIAVKQEDYKLIDWLISMCVDKSIKNKSGLTAYDVAVNNSNYKIMKMVSTGKEKDAECLVDLLASISL
ncbi:putative ankyrin repeat protein RF_0381 [Cydia pomonella]|uniref:putative ankyrin repeat protein RF_0381 n=1 Tax=Cydia pomonella TaxID=82600 RepID=UPI002ADE0D58|nr:putative ankyrin repeat protein RF_0381 [Cydia pomonella]